MEPDDAQADRPDTLEQVLGEVLLLPVDRQEPELERVCTQYPDLADALRRAFHWVHDAGLITKAGAPDVDASVGRRPPAIGGLELDRLLGAGGMGEVWRAEQLRPVRRTVAVKRIRHRFGGDVAQLARRFAAESQALARMSHPCIAQIHDAGVTDEGEPYFVMEFVDGVPLHRYCEERRLDIDDRLRLLIRVCEGVQHAHQKGIVHRDLKPSNVLVVEHEGVPTPKIIDFGIAKPLGDKLTEDTVYTEQGVLIGTPDYMSPEQAGGDPQDVDTRTDVYALGVVLYELLTGCRPFVSSELPRLPLPQLVEAIRERVPVRPSARVANGSTTAVERRLRGDLDWITMKAIEKDRDRRYGSATELADDLRRYLAGEPVRAGPPTTRYRLGKWARKYRLQVGAAAAVLVTAVAGTVVASYYAFQADARATEAARERTNALAREAEARDQERIARRENERFNRLAAVVILEEARTAAKGLQRVGPEAIGQVDAWLADFGGRLAAELPLVDATIRQLAADGGGSPGQPKLQDPADRFLYEQLTAAERGIESFLGDSGLHKEVQALRAWLEALPRLSLEHPNARCSWADARAALSHADGESASRLYGKEGHDRHPIDLAPQLGLVPIGKNPVTGLWEFYHLRSAFVPGKGTDPASLAIPAHGEDGRIAVGPRTGIVFVLIPGGTFWMGAQRDDPTAPNHDPAVELEDLEGKPRKESVAPFFLSRFELTQAQWMRLAGAEKNPSRFPSGLLVGEKAITWSNPVEQVSFDDGEAVLAIHGLRVPTRMEWEYCARAGTSTPWYCGTREADLEGYENVRDRYAKENGFGATPMRGVDFALFDDGHALHAPVGSFKPNPWGLHDMLGNVMEWTSTEVEGAGPSSMAVCGTSFMGATGTGRVTATGPIDRRRQSNITGFRVAMSLRD